MKIHPAWLTVGLLLLVVLACQTSTSNSNSSSSGSAISEIKMAKDNGKGEPGDETNTFSPSDHTLHCLAKLANPKEGIKVRFTWWIVDAGDSKNEKIKEIDYTTESADNMVHGHLTLPRDWPKGKYKVEVYINGDLDKTISYNVQ